ncbi:MAG: hypothetical protein BIFFINMI_00263 [Phycisphaerae bacterium]|nr:hypothetical protein [Phycisphaerae bacterium]
MNAKVRAVFALLPVLAAAGGITFLIVILARGSGSHGPANEATRADSTPAGQTAAVPQQPSPPPDATPTSTPPASTPATPSGTGSAWSDEPPVPPTPIHPSGVVPPPSAPPAAAPAPAPDRLHLGQWQGKDSRGDMASYDFRADGSVMVGQGGLLVPMRYEIDYGHSPAWLDFIILLNGEEISRIRCLVEFGGQDAMTITSKGNATRPKEIAPADREHTIRYTRGQAAGGADGDEVVVVHAPPPLPPQADPTRHLGRWQGMDAKGGGVMAFRGDGTVLIKGDKDGDARTDRYVFDYTKSPIQLDMTTTDGTPRTLLCIVEFTGPDSMRIRWNRKARPANFDGATDDDTVTLTRQ